jgi:hypothetical protein
MSGTDVIGVTGGLHDPAGSAAQGPISFSGSRTPKVRSAAGGPGHRPRRGAFLTMRNTAGTGIRRVPLADGRRNFLGP